MSQPRKKQVPRLKVLCMGDPGCGKTSLCNAFGRGIFSQESILGLSQDGLHGHVKELELNGRQIELDLWDAPGGEQHDFARHVLYDEVDVVLLCYAVDDEKSLHDLQEKWIVEASRIELKRVSRILVGCKTDLRNDPGVLDAAKNAGKRMLTTEDGSKIASRLNARFVECSAKREDNVRMVFEHAARVAMQRRKWISGCVIA